MQFHKIADRGKPLVPNPTGGFLADGTKASPAESVDPDTPTFSKVLKHVVAEVARDEERISPGFLAQAKREGWVEVERPHRLAAGDEVTFLTVPQVRYKVTRERGRYCCHCGEKLEDDPLESGEDARAHVAAEHAGEESPDSENPSGYRCDNFVVMEKVT